MKINPLSCALLLILVSCHSLSSSKISKKDLKKDVELVTTEGVIVLRLYDDTPLSRSNFLKLAKTGMYDSIQFHRVIEKFMIQAGERVHEESFKKKKELYGFEDLVPAEISAGHFHKRGALAAAREGDDSNPKQQGSFIQFYIVHGRTYTDSTLDLTEKRINKSLAYNQVINDPANASTFTTYQNLIKNRSGNNQEAIKKLKSELDS
ncbi:peptidylprolyl isomerase, partial [Algoriphagus sp.]